MVRRLLIFLLITALSPLSAETIDRIAAIIDRQVLTVSEIDQLVMLRVFTPAQDESEDEFRRRVLDTMIAQALRRRDIERFGAPEISPDAVQSRMRTIRGRFATEADFLEALARAEMSEEELEAVVKRQLELDAYINERFAPQVFVSLAQIEQHYREVYAPQRRERGLPVRPLDQVREEIRGILRSERLEGELDLWTTQLRQQANVDVYAW